MRNLTKLLLVSVLVSFLAGSLNASPIVVPSRKKGSVKKETSVGAPAEKTKATSAKAELKKELKKFKKDNPGATKKGAGKSKVLAAVLAFLLGNLGVHSFYMGQTAKGFMQLGGTALGITLIVIGLKDWVSGMGESFPTLALIGYIVLLGVGIWALVDFIRILTGGLEPEEGFDS